MNGDPAAGSDFRDGPDLSRRLAAAPVLFEMHFLELQSQPFPPLAFSFDTLSL